MQKIVPHLWFDKEAREAAAFYTSIFPGSGITHTTTLKDTPSGDTDVVTFNVWGQKFMAISAGPLFKFNPSVSFLVNFDPLLFKEATTPGEAAKEKLDEVWANLSEGGTVLMPLGEYPFSRRFGWVQDKFGLSWQLMLTNPEGEPRPPVIPFLLFAGSKCGKAEEAISFYTSVFRNSKTGGMRRYGKDQLPDREGTVMFADFMIEDTWFAAIDSAHEHKFDFNEAVSFVIRCKDQAEIDYYWEQLSAVPGAEQCGWLKDQFGISWQVVPVAMEDMMNSGTGEQTGRLTQAFLQMKKLDINKLTTAFRGA